MGRRLPVLSRVRCTGDVHHGLCEPRRALVEASSLTTPTRPRRKSSALCTEVTKRLKGKRKTHGVVKDASWVKKKKDLYRSRGKEGVPRDSKYTARKRKPRF